MSLLVISSRTWEYVDFFPELFPTLHQLILLVVPEAPKVNLQLGTTSTHVVCDSGTDGRLSHRQGGNIDRQLCTAVVFEQSLARVFLNDEP